MAQLTSDFRWSMVRLWCVLVAAWFAAPLVDAAERGPEPIAFDLPSDRLEKSAKLFAAQSGFEILLPGDAVADIRTKAVRGRMSPMEALEAMLAGTGLRIVREARSGAFAIRKESTHPNVPRAAPAPNGVRPAPRPDTSPNMTNRKTPVALLAAWLGLAAAPLASGQAGATGIIEGHVSHAVTGASLEKVRLTVEGTALEAFTGSDGTYRLSGLPAGNARVKAFYTGLVPLLNTVPVSGGQTVRHDISLSPSRSEAVVTLAEMVVSSSREMDGAAIAINEQRFAGNMMNVVSADEFGTIAEGSVGEFLKFMPGISIDFANGDANSVSMNGAPSDYVPITIGGFEQASANVAELNSDMAARTVLLDQTSMNNVARVEVVFTPTPETSGAALAGSINLVPRSAFERSRPVFSYSAYFTLRDNERDFGKSELPWGRTGHKVRPGFNFTYTNPVNKRFGFTLSGGAVSNYVSEYYIQTMWRGASAPTNGAAFPDTTPDRPYLTQLDLVDGLKITKRSSLGATVDFKLTDRDRISLAVSYGTKDTEIDGNRMAFFIDQVTLGNFTPTSTRSNPGAGRVNIFGGDMRGSGETITPTFTYRHDGPIWRAELGASYSRATGKTENGSGPGLFWNQRAILQGVTVAFDDIFYLRPRQISVTNPTTGAAVDPWTLSNYLLNTADLNSRDAIDVRRSVSGSVRRDFHGRVPVSFKAGADVRHQMRDTRGETQNSTYLGPDGIAANADNAALPFVDEVISQRTPPWGFPQMQWLSNVKTWQRYQQSPAQFQINEVAAHNNRVNFSKHAEETVSAAYLRGDVQFLDRRLKLVGGLRVEQTNVEGEGRLLDPRLNFQKDVSGRVLTAPNGTPLLINPANSLAAVQLTTLDRGLKAEKEYLRWFPSLNGSYNIRDNLIARAGFYTSVGRPNFAQYAGSLTLPNIELPPAPNNRITTNNAGIKAWSARTVRVGLEYYFEGVGLVSVGAFRRDFDNFFGSTVFGASPEFLGLYGLDSGSYGAYEVATQYNIPDPVRMTGLDFNYKQALTFLPRWARGVQVFTNASALRATGGATANFAGYVPRSGSWGVSLTRPKYHLRANWNYRGRNRGNLVTGRGIEPSTYNWESKRLYIDLSGEYTFHRRFAVFANLRNIRDASDDVEIAGPSTPPHAQFRAREEYGSLWTIGVKGTF
jgi:iron complex outermembrane recepter protein